MTLLDIPFSPFHTNLPILFDSEHFLVFWLLTHPTDTPYYNETGHEFSNELKFRKPGVFCHDHTNNRAVNKRVGVAFIAQVALTSIHHVYGGLLYDSTFRLSMPIIAVVELPIVLGLLFWYRQNRSGVALVLFCIVAALVGVVLGLIHTLYGHLYKDILFLAGIPADTVRNFFLPVIPNDFIYPPNDLFFEATGVLELATICLIAIFTYRLIRNWRLEKQIGSRPLAKAASESVNA